MRVRQKPRGFVGRIVLQFLWRVCGVARPERFLERPDLKFTVKSAQGDFVIMTPDGRECVRLYSGNGFTELEAETWANSLAMAINADLPSEKGGV